MIVGFAAETDDLLDNARDKLAKKRADFIVANDVSRADVGFQGDHNEVTVIGHDGEEQYERQPKTRLAERLIARFTHAVQERERQPA